VAADRPRRNLPSIAAWRAEAGLANLRAPLELDLFHGRWPVSAAQAVVCINTVHIVAWKASKICSPVPGGYWNRVG